MKSFGEFVRDLRIHKRLLLRQVAASISMDPSLLSRIESGAKRPTREHVIALSKVLDTDEAELLIHYLSDRVVYELKGEALAGRAIVAAEQKIAYHHLVSGRDNQASNVVTPRHNEETKNKTTRRYDSPEKKNQKIKASSSRKPGTT